MIVEAVKALNAVLVAFRYLTRAGDTGAYSNRRLKVGGERLVDPLPQEDRADINWITNPYGPRLVTDYPPAMVGRSLAIERTPAPRCGHGVGRGTATGRDALADRLHAPGPGVGHQLGHRRRVRAHRDAVERPP